MLVRDAVERRRSRRSRSRARQSRWRPIRLLTVVPGVPGRARRPDTPMVGRERERTVCGAIRGHGRRPGVPARHGARPRRDRKVATRRRFFERVGDAADILRGRCLSYGEGITYWPLVEILIAIGVEPDSVIGTLPPRPSSRSEAPRGRAAARPQVVVVDDLQWAEPVFVDLVEHVTDLSRGGTDLPALCRAHRAARCATGLGRGKLTRRRCCSNRSARSECGALVESLALDAPLDDESARAHRRGVGREPALRRGDARDGPRAAETARSSSLRRSRRSSRRVSTRWTATCGW